MSKKVLLEKKVKSKSTEISDQLRQGFKEKDIYVVNFIGSPGAGKTSLIEAMAPHLIGRTAVIEGDLQTDEDKQRIEKAGLPAYEINTIGACHLDAKMIQKAIDEFPVNQSSFLFIENVGNLVCPFSFDIGEDMKVAVISVTEGDDKPAKYPVALYASRALVITKTDLLPYVKCDVDRMERDSLAANPDIKVFRISSTTGEGIESFIQWLNEQGTSK
jgi:hydrogenase nickel incorporation protein HypB